MITRCYLIITVLLISLFITSCASNNKIKPVSKRPLTVVLEGMKSKFIDYTYFSTKLRLKYNGEESKVGGRSRLLMIKDSLIWMNFKKLSVEGARTLIKPDSCWVLYRFDDIYESGRTQEFLDYYKIYLPFGDLQNLLVGNFHIPEANNVQHYELADRYHIVFNLNADRYEYLINEDFSIFRMIIRDTFGREITVTQTEYGEEHIATHKELLIDIPGEGRSKISMKLSNIEFEVIKDIKFEIPAHYTRIP